MGKNQPIHLSFYNAISLRMNLLYLYTNTRLFPIITGRNEVVAKVMFFTRVCDSVHVGGLPQCMLGYHPPE